MCLEAAFIGAYVFPTIALIIQTVVLRRFLIDTPSISNELAAEYGRIGAAWVAKLFPDF